MMMKSYAMDELNGIELKVQKVVRVDFSGRVFRVHSR